jgi:hypothetical protein
MTATATPSAKDPVKLIDCRYCGQPFRSLPGKPGFIDECTSCLALRKVFAVTKNIAHIKGNIKGEKGEREPSKTSLSVAPLPAGCWRVPNTLFPKSCPGCKIQIEAGQESIWVVGTKFNWHEKCLRLAREGALRRT